MKKPIAKKKIHAELEGVRRVKDIRRSRSWVFYGRSGSGKTTIAASFPGPILLLDVRDHGTDSIIDRDVDVKEVDNLDELEDAYYYLKENPKAYPTVVIDTVSQLQQVITEEVTHGARKNGRAAGDWGSMSRRQFGDVSAAMKEWLLNFRNLTDLGIEVAFIAQERTSKIEDDDSGIDDNMIIPEVGPELMPSIAKFLNANVTAIVNTFIKLKTTKIKRGNKTTEKQNVLYCQRVGPNPIYVTKLRKPSGIEAPPWIENGVYKDLVEAIEGE